MKTPKVMLFCLDSVPPDLLFDKLLHKLPNISRLYNRGIYGRLESCHPPITIPAWMVMMTGKNPGRLGIYGFRHRKGWSYEDGYIVNSGDVREPCVWDIIGEEGLKSCVIGLPPTYPPKPIKGYLISCLVTPNAKKDYTYPPELKGEIEDLVGEYMFDITFRTEDRDKIKEQLFTMTEKRFEVARYLAREKEWNLFILHEIGFDRLHHMFWKYFDPQHPKYVSGSRYEKVFEEYYEFVDRKIGEILGEVDKEVKVMILSDHGSKAMQGAFCINEWLIKEGYLVLKERPKGIVDPEQAEIDWSRTKAWAWGGYYARIFFNVKGREPNGVIEQRDLEKIKSELRAKLMQIRGPNGRYMRNLVYEPEELYGKAYGDKPDLMVYLDELNWRSAGTIGHNSLFLDENDKGPDDSVHSMEAVFMYADDEYRGGREIGTVRAIDIAPTLLRIFGLSVPPDMEGRAIELH